MKLVICGFLRSLSGGGGQLPNDLLLWVICQQYLSPTDLSQHLAGLADCGSVAFFFTAPCISLQKLCQMIRYFQNNFLYLMALIEELQTKYEGISTTLSP